MAPLQDQVVPIKFSGGLDTKRDPKTVLVGDFLFIENGVYTDIDRVQKRNGYSVVPTAILGGGNISSPRMVRVFNGELICQSGTTLYGYSPALSCWIAKGNYESLDFSETFVFKTLTTTGVTDCMVSGNIAVYVWETVLTPPAGGNSIPNVYAAVIDLNSNQAIIAPTLLSNFGGSAPASAVNTTTPRCVLLGNGQIGVTYVRNLTGDLVIRLLTTSTGSASFTNEVVLGTGLYGASLTAPFYDIVGTSTGAALAYFTQAAPNTITVKTINNSANILNTNTFNLNSSNGTQAVALCVEPSTGAIWVYYTDTVGGLLSIRYKIYSSTVVQTLASTTIASPNQFIGAISARVNNSTTQTVYYSYLVTGSNNVILDQTFLATAQSNGTVGTPAMFLLGARPASRPFIVNGLPYGVYVYRGPIYSTGVTNTNRVQPTYFVINLATETPVARFGAAVAYNFLNVNDITYVGNVPLASSTQALFSCGIQYQSVANVVSRALVGISSVSFSFNTLRTYKTASSKVSLVLNGALMSYYDGQNCAEWGFHMAPEISKVQTTTGLIAAGTYNYIAVWQWLDASGDLHTSQTSLPQSFTLGAPGGAIVTVTAPYLTGKKNVILSLYRNILATPGIFYQVGDPSVLTIWDGVSPTMAITDISSDALIAANGILLYTTGGVNTNTPPPPSLILESRYNRLWFVDAEHPNTIDYSKTYVPGTGLSPTGLNLLNVDPKQGNIAGLATMDNYMLVPKDGGIFYFTGDGGNDTGQGSSLSVPQPIPSDVGCSNGASIIMLPKGMMFQTLNGMYLLDRSLNVHYADQFFNGAAVEAFNSQLVTEARLVPGVSQVRLLTASGKTLVYDYIFNKWSTFTNHLGYSADNWNGAYTYVRTDGAIYTENSTTFLDGATAYALRVQTSWIALAGINGFERVKQLLLSGDYAAGSASTYGLQISFAYDFSATFSAPVPYSFGTANTAVQEFSDLRWFLARQKCAEVSLLIEEVPTGASGEYLDLTAMSFLAGVKKGLRRVPAASSVG